ncbi:LOW QUALITY PROTEIN: hypothetical protein OSB04_030996 [Centaurea solstitialis]|uniref:Uncharacterized protein n=1 Tax=Centaurea solstitialis TaxID=347529 RepID=A0AA38SG82_9ASTR|nr:LOW QUALITY PROTEIN: hypothetical protein OSB04_030996 [Centaurea solstitialis]
MSGSVETDPPGKSGGSESLIAKLDFGDPLYLHPSDTSGTPILNFKLCGTENYKVWSCAMILAIETKNKLGFVDESCARPTDDPVLAKQWDRCNSVVLSWILGSVTEELFLGQVFSKIASTVWNELKETYDKVDGSVTFNLHQRINSLSQNGGSVSDYYHKLNALWRQFDALVKLPNCTCNASAEFTKHTQLIKLMQFLMGLDEIYQPIRSSILTIDPLPSVKAAFSIVSREESHRGVLTSSLSKTQSSAYASKFIDNKKRTNFRTTSPLICKHCGINGHTIERCFKLIGFPKDFQNQNQRKSSFNTNFRTVANNVTDSNISQPIQSSSNVSLTEDQIQKLLSLLDKPSSSERISAYMAGKVFASSYMTNVSFYSSLPWIIDSGTTQHMTSSVSQLENVIDISDLSLKVKHPNGTFATIHKVGNKRVTPNITLFDVLVVPEFDVNLLSVHKLVRDSKLQVVFDEDTCHIQDCALQRNVGTGNEKGGLYLLETNVSESVRANNITTCYASKSLWHSRLGHPAEPVMQILKGKLNFDSNKVLPCDICHLAKQARSKFEDSSHKTTQLGDIIHLDVWGPYKVSTKEGFKYFLTVVDDYTRSVWVYLMKGKDEVYENIVSFTNMIQTQFHKCIKNFRTDNGTEFVNHKFSQFTKGMGIIHQTSCVYTPQQNGVVERKHRHLLNVARALLFQSGLPLNMWHECILTATYLINRTPSSVLNGKSPYEMVYGHSPNLDHLRNFGCLCFAVIPNIADKFASRAQKCVFLGYSSSKKGYRLASLDTKQEFVSRDVKFYENIFPYNMKEENQGISSSGTLNTLNFFDFVVEQTDNVYNDFPDDDIRGRSQNLSTINDSATDSFVSHDHSTNIPSESRNESTTIEQDDVDIIGGRSGVNQENRDHSSEGNFPNTNISTKQRKSDRISNLPKRFDDFVIVGKVKYGIEKVVNYASLCKDNYCFISNLNKSVEPSNYTEASKDSNWVNAMNEEMEALHRNGTWDLTELPTNRKPIGCKWVYKIKYKARLVAKGYSQREGLDYEETFSPVVKMVTVRCLIAIAVQNSWPLFQLDINNAFLYGDLNEEVYMSLPEGIILLMIQELIKSLYGLKQAPRQWYEKLSNCLIEFGFVQNPSDYSLFTLSRNKVFLALLVYVDDIVITGNNHTEIHKDLGELQFFMGIEILKTEFGLCMSQRKYCLELLNDFGYQGCKPIKTPMDMNLIVTDTTESASKSSDTLLVDVSGFQRLIGRLIYLLATRPDISFVVHCLSQFMHAPRKSHLNLALRVMRYLKQSPGKGISFSPSSEFKLCGFVDSDWGKCLSSRRSVSGYCLFLGNCLISSKSKKQSTVSRSSSESEYRAMAVVTCEIVWILNILNCLNVNDLIPVPLYCDNNSAIQIANNPVLHERTKHIEIDIHYVREKVSAGVIETVKIESTEQIADIFTKSLPTNQHNYLCSKLKLYYSARAKQRKLIKIWTALQVRWNMKGSGAVCYKYGVSSPQETTKLNVDGSRKPESGKCTLPEPGIHVSRIRKTSVSRIGNGLPEPGLAQSGSESGFPPTRIGICTVHPNRVLPKPEPGFSARSESGISRSRVGLFVSRVLVRTVFFESFFQNQVIHSKGIFFFEDMMSREIVSMGSESRPPVLVMGEYAQWKLRMIHFLDQLDRNLMKSIREGPVRPTVTIAEVPETDTCPLLPSYTVEKPYHLYNQEQRERHEIDKRAMSLLIMSLPNDMYSRVDSFDNARDIWIEIEQQMQGGDTASEFQKESAMNAYEGFHAKEGELLHDSYQRLNSLVNDLRRLKVEKSRYEVNVKFLKNLNPEWRNLAINIQLSRNLGQMGLHDLFSMMVQHEEFITGNKPKKSIDPLALAAVHHGGSNLSVNPYPEEYYQDYHYDVSQDYYQHSDNSNDPTIITVTDEELHNMNESLALITHKMQRLTANRGFNRSSSHGGNRFGPGRGGHQSFDQGRGHYPQGGRYQSSDRGRGGRGRFGNNFRHDNTFLDYQGSSGNGHNYQGNFQGSGYNQHGSYNNQGAGYGQNFSGQGYEGKTGAGYDDGRFNHHLGSYDQGRNGGGDQNNHGGNFNGGSHPKQPPHGKGVQISEQQLGASSTQVQNPQPMSSSQGKTNGHGPTCFKCGTPGHYAKDCKAVYKDAAYF